MTYDCNKCNVEFETMQCPECGLNASEAEDWVTDEELYKNWQERIDYSRKGDLIIIESEEIAKHLNIAFGVSQGIPVDDVPDLLSKIDEELALLDSTRFGFYTDLFDAKMAIHDAL